MAFLSAVHFLTGSHGKLRVNTEGRLRSSDMSTASGARFRQKFTLEDAIGSHACSLEVNTRVTNGIPLGSSPLLPVDTVNCVATRKELAELGVYGMAASQLTGYPGNAASISMLDWNNGLGNAWCGACVVPWILSALGLYSPVGGWRFKVPVFSPWILQC
jgi:hypothetical protein